MQKLLLFLVLFSLNQDKILSQNTDSVDVDKHLMLTDRYRVKMGFFANLKSVSLNVDGTLPSNPIDFGQTLGLRRQENTFDLNFEWRFSKDKNWIFGFEFFTVRNSQTITLSDEIKWNNTVFPGGVILESGLDIEMYRIFFGRVISMGKKHELSGGIGIHTLNIHSFIEATGYIGDIDFELDSSKKKIDALAPVPNIGIRYLYAPHWRWGFEASVGWFSLSIGDYSGTLWNLEPSVSFQVFENIGLGLGYKYFKAKLDLNKDVWKGRVDLLYQGPLFSISGIF